MGLDPAGMHSMLTATREQIISISTGDGAVPTTGIIYLNNLNPGGSNFTEGQGAIINIYPDTTNYYLPLLLRQPGFADLA